MVDVAFNKKKLSNPKMLLSLQPGKVSEKIDPKFSSARVAKLVRILKEIPHNFASSNDTEVRIRLSRSAVHDIESLLHKPNLLTVEHFCKLYEINVDNFFYLAKKNEDMTTIDAVLYVAIDLES